MRALQYVLLVLIGSTAMPASSQGMGSMKPMPGMASRGQATGASKTGHGIGVITALDPKANKLTIKHGPIPAVGWPAMSMTFTATPPSLLKGLRIGQKIAFDVKTKGSAAEVTAVKLK
jgi:Cu(I)/Ag(I) efflux system protein CusF